MVMVWLQDTLPNVQQYLFMALNRGFVVLLVSRLALEMPHCTCRPNLVSE